MSKYNVYEYFDIFPGRGTNFCFNGLLRSFCPDDGLWISAWELRSGLKFKWSEALSYDVFGSVYGVDQRGQVYILSLDSGDKSDLGVDVNGFFEAIKADPVSTIRINLYEEAEYKIGKISESENYALKVEAALDGRFCVENMFICDRLKHAYILGEIARQIKDLPVGTGLNLRI